MTKDDMARLMDKAEAGTLFGENGKWLELGIRVLEFPDSSMVDKVAFVPNGLDKSAERGTLYVTYKSKGVPGDVLYCYLNAPESVWEAVQSPETPSVGKLLNREVKGKYEFVRMERD